MWGKDNSYLLLIDFLLFTSKKIAFLRAVSIFFEVYLDSGKINLLLLSAEFSDLMD